MITYQSVIRSYARAIGTGHADTDLTPRQRRIAQVLLGLASNSHWATGTYPPTDGNRESVRRALCEIVWDARALVEAASPGSHDDFEAAYVRALAVLTGV